MHWAPSNIFTGWKPGPSSDELMHHGILGMQWGVQNGPPYPLGSGDHSAKEKKAGWRKSLGNGDIKSAKQSKESPLYSNDMSDVIKKHRMKKTSSDDKGYGSYKTKEGVLLEYWKDGDWAPTPQEMDEVLTNYSKADKKAIFEDCKKYCWETAHKYWPEDAGTKEEFYKQFDEDYQITTLFLRGKAHSKNVELNIDMKPGIWESVMGDHCLDMDYDRQFKQKQWKEWSING